MSTHTKHISQILYTALFVMVCMFGYATYSYAQEQVQEIQETIQATASQLKQLEEGIKKDESNLNRLASEKQTLSKALSSLAYSERKLTGEISQTEEEIQETQEKIKTLSETIADLSVSLDTNRQYIGEILSEIHKEGDTGVWEAILLYDTFSEYLNRSSDFARTGDVLKENLEELEGTKNALIKTSTEQEDAKRNLESQKEVLGDKKQVVAYAKQEKATILEQTKNQEKVYQNSLAEKIQIKQEFEQAISQLENKLRIALDSSAYQQALRGLFSWPFNGMYRITQFFGNTSYAAGGAYNGRGHSGSDFAAPLGTPVLAVMDGVVTAADDTGAQGGRDANGIYHQCVSYGKWIVINHQNGLSTRVNHLSLIKVKDGDKVRRGQIIGYSGNTGISTGPHLHISVMATQGVQIKRLGEVINTNYCKNARAPIVAANAYLDPFDYLPRPYFTLSRVSFGTNSRAVSNLQMMLKHERIFPIEVSANGVYGPTTEQAILKWKKKYGMKGDGKSFTQDDIDKYESFF